MTREEVLSCGWTVNNTDNPSTIGKIIKSNGFSYGIKYTGQEDNFFLIHSIKESKSGISTEYSYRGPIENVQELMHIMNLFGLITIKL